MTDASPFDIVVFGATGFTGKLVAEHLAGHHHGANAPRWALAGRSAAKLVAARDEIGAPADTALIEVDANVPAALATLVGSTRAVITTVGPYQLYGSALVAACAAAGTDYLDLCGEPLWMRAMIDAHGETAKRTGARILFSCGFDSIPSEIGVWLCQQAARDAGQAPFTHVSGRHVAIQGGVGGGSVATGAATQQLMAQDPSYMASLIDPFLLTPGFTGPEQPSPLAQSVDPDFGPVLPFLLAPINIMNVHRSNLLMGQPYGADFVYDEMVVAELRGTNPFSPEFAAALAVAPGEGPSREAREAGFFEMAFVGRDGDRATRVTVSSDLDPGHTATARMIAESAICLLNAHDVAGGIWTPLAALQARLVERLRTHAGLKTETEPTG